jgi:hypothetical protein
LKTILNKDVYITVIFTVPMPVIREPTDYIPNSADSSQNTSREVTLAGFSKTEESVDSTQRKENSRPKVVSVFCRQHVGQPAPAPYSIKPSQMVFI